MKLDRRRFTGALISTLFLRKGWTDPAELPPCPDGFSWRRSHALEAFIPCPTEWFLHEKYNRGSTTVYCTREEHARTNQFMTGFVVNVVPHMDGDICAWCNAIVKICLEGIAPLDQLEESNEQYYTYGVEKVDPPKGYRKMDTRIRIVGVGNKNTNALYLIQFESPADEWASDWEIGRQIYEMFKINSTV